MSSENAKDTPPHAGKIYLDMNIGLINMDNTIPAMIVKNITDNDTKENPNILLSFLLFLYPQHIKTKNTSFLAKKP